MTRKSMPLDRRRTDSDFLKVALKEYDVPELERCRISMQREA
jgi:hypothetical protein